MAGPADVDRVQVVLVDQPVEVDVGERLAGVGAPVAQHARLDVLDLQRLAEQGVVLEVEHPQAQVEAGPPVGVDLFQLLGAERGAADRRAGGAVGRDRRGARLRCQVGVGPRAAILADTTSRCERRHGWFSFSGRSCSFTASFLPKRQGQSTGRLLGHARSGILLKNLRIPSASLSVAMASSLCIHRNVFWSKRSSARQSHSRRPRSGGGPAVPGGPD